jgi:hypothetical protein
MASAEAEMQFAAGFTAIDTAVLERVCRPLQLLTSLPL